MTEKKFDPKKLDKLNDPKRKKMHDPEVAWNTLAPNNPEVIIDIGAGTGFFSKPFSDKMPDGKVYACDTSDEMLEFIVNNLTKEQTNRIIPLKSEENHIDLDDGIADIVLMIMLYHELDDAKKLLSESKRLLKSGGSIVIIDWKKEETPMGPPVHLRVEEATIIDDLNQCGYGNIVRHDPFPVNTFIVATKP